MGNKSLGIIGIEYPEHDQESAVSNHLSEMGRGTAGKRLQRSQGDYPPPAEG